MKRTPSLKKPPKATWVRKTLSISTFRSTGCSICNRSASRTLSTLIAVTTTCFTSSANHANLRVNLALQSPLKSWKEMKCCYSRILANLTQPLCPVGFNSFNSSLSATRTWLIIRHLRRQRAKIVRKMSSSRGTRLRVSCFGRMKGHKSLAYSASCSSTASRKSRSGRIW